LRKLFYRRTYVKKSLLLLSLDYQETNEKGTGQ